MNPRISNNNYDVVKMERLKHYLESHAEKGRPRFFEIFVDNLKAVDKTNDPSLFDDYTVYMDEDTSLVKVVIYSTSETSPRNDKFLFTVNNPAAVSENKQELNGLEVQEKIDSAIRTERSRNELENLRLQLAEKTKQLEEAESYADDLEEEITKLKEAKDSNAKEIKWGQLASVALEETIKRNPVWLQKVPLLGNLSGFLNEEPSPFPNELPGSSTPDDSSVSFAKKSVATDTVVLSEADKSRLEFLKSIEPLLSEAQYEKVISIVQALAAQTQYIDTVYDLLFNSIQNASSGN